MRPIGRGWWDVAGWAAFAVALGVELYGWARGEPLGRAADWATTALYFVGVAAVTFLGARARHLRERIVDSPRSVPSWVRILAMAAFLVPVLLLVDHMDVLHKEGGVPFGVILLGLGLLGWVLRPLSLRAWGKELLPADAAAREAKRPPAEREAIRRMGWKQVVLGTFVALALLILYQAFFGPRTPRIEGPEAEAALTELDALGQEAFRHYMRLGALAKQQARVDAAAPDAQTALERRVEQALKAHAKAVMWQTRLRAGRVRVSERAELQRDLQALRETLDALRPRPQAEGS